MLFLLTFYLQTILHFTPLQAGLVFLAASVSFILSSLLSPAIVSRPGKRGLSAAAGLVTLGYVLVFLAAQFLVPRWGMKLGSQEDEYIAQQMAGAFGVTLLGLL